VSIEVDLTRADWGAAGPNYATATVPFGSRPGVEAHHTVGTYGVPVDGRRGNEAGRIAKAIQGDHLGRGWADVFYHYMIHRDGTIVELRDVTWKSGPIDYVTVVFPGNYDNLELNDRQKAAFLKLRGRLVAAGVGEKVRRHRDRASVSCPGRSVAAWVGQGFPSPYRSAPAADKAPRGYVTRGDRGDQVREVQREVARLLPGHPDLHDPDGIFGPKTARLVVDAYDLVGLTASDPERPRVGPKSLAAFRAAEPAGTLAEPGFVFEHDVELRSGSEGPAVKELQEALAAYAPDDPDAHDPDGAFGPMTARWAARVMVELGLVSSAPGNPIVGPRTRAALEDELA